MTESEKRDYILEGIEVGKRYDEYTKEELAVMPAIPDYKPGEDYPERYEKMPLYWYGRKWVLIYE